MNSEYKPRFANTPEEFVFLTDTNQVDYPVFLLPNKEVVYKRKPETERYAVFHVKQVKEVKSAWASSGSRLDLENILAAFPNLPLREVVEAARAVVSEYDVRVYHMAAVYEVYRGDYEEPLGEYEVPYALVVIQPHYSYTAPEKQQFAITYATLKRFLAKLPENIRAYVEKRAYVATKYVKKRGDLPIVKIKLPAPTPEFERTFNDVVAWLTAPRVTAAAPALAPEPEEVEPEEVESLFKEPEELPVAAVSTTSPAPSPASAQQALSAGSAETPAEAQPSKSELVKIYLLSMRLPSKYLVQSVEYNASKTSVKEVRVWAGERAKIASRLESIRRMALTKVSRVFAFVEEYGTWIAVTDAALEETEKVSQFVVDELRKLGLDHFAERYVVKAVPVYLEPAEARELLAAAVRSLSRDVDALKGKIEAAEKEQKRRELRRLKAELDRVNVLLSQFLTEMRRRGW